MYLPIRRSLVDLEITAVRRAPIRDRGRGSFGRSPAPPTTAPQRLDRLTQRHDDGRVSRRASRYVSITLSFRFTVPESVLIELTVLYSCTGVRDPYRISTVQLYYLYPI